MAGAPIGQVNPAKLAGAPISWGVCEVPGWGRALPPRQVLSEMRSLGLAATELGPPGYLGSDSASIRRHLESAGLRALGGFRAVILHDPRTRTASLADAEAEARRFHDLGCAYFISSPIVDERWSSPRRLDDREWRLLLQGLEELERISEAHGLIHVVHPHVGTLIETEEDVERLMATSNVRWCLDTGHLSLGGTDPAAFARRHGDRVALVHLKDARQRLAPDLLARRISLLQAVRDGVFCPLGDGDVDVRGVVKALIDRGYDGWWTFEQDATIDDQAPVPDLAAGVRRSLEYLLRVGG